MRIQHNIMAMSAYRNYTNNVSAMKKNLEKLSSGYKINRAGDDAAGLAISEKMRAQITGLETAQKNAKDGISLVQTAEGALTEVHDMLNRMVELASQSANGTYDNTTDRNQMQKEIDQLRSEINRIADSSNFNGINLLDGTMALSSETFQVEHTVGSSVAQGMKYTNVAIATGNFGVKGTSHFTGSVSGKTAQFKIDLADMEFTAKKTAGGSFDATKFEVVVAGQTITATVATTAIGSDGKITATDIAGALKTAFNKGVKNTATTATAAATAGHVIGSANSVFKATVSGTVLTFNYVGKASSGVMATTALTGTAEAAAINTALKSGAVTVTPTASTTKPAAGKLVDCHIYDITESVYAPAAQRAGIDLTLDNTIVKQGNMLTIDSKAFIFQTGTAAVTVPSNVTNYTLINVSKASDKIREAVIQLAKTSKATTNFEINAVGANKIHIDQKPSTFPNKKYSYDDLKKVFSLAKQTIPAAVTSGAVTEISLKGDMIPQNSQITIASKTYKFVDASTAAAKASATDAVYIDVAQGLNGLKNKLGSTLGTVTVSTDGKTLTITGTNPNASAAAKVEFKGLGLTLQIGDTADPWNQLNVNISDCHTHSLGIKDISIADQKDAQTAVDKIKAAINYVSDVRGTLGATQNRLDHTINNLSVMTENIQDAESTIRDTDVAEEMMAYTKNNILIQSAQAMLAQANQVPQGVLQLLQ